LSRTPPAPTRSLLQYGVSQGLARWRAAHYRDLRYSIRLNLEPGAASIRGSITLQMRFASAPVDLVLDWRGAAEAVSELRVDGGATSNDLLMQFQADVLGVPVVRPRVTETTALGAAFLAGMQAGVCGGPEEFAKSWALDRRFTAAMDAPTRDAKYARWGRAVAATMSV